jgi:hypothetical protein
MEVMKRLMTYVLIFVTLLVIGQNCSAPQDFEATKVESSRLSPGNGQGYGGKVYVNLVENEGLCADQSRVKARIEFTAQFAQLTRWNCSELAIHEWTSVAVTPVPNDPARVTYSGLTFEDGADFGITAPVRAPVSLALNFNGPDLVIDSRVFASATNYGFSGTVAAVEDQTVVLSPATDANRETMIRSSIWGGSGTTGYQIGIPIPTGKYQVYFYTWEETMTRAYSLSIEGTNFIDRATTPARGTWQKLGPFDVDVRDGVMTIDVDGAHFMISGMEINGVP